MMTLNTISVARVLSVMLAFALLGGCARTRSLISRNSTKDSLDRVGERSKSSSRTSIAAVPKKSPAGQNDVAAKSKKSSDRLKSVGVRSPDPYIERKPEEPEIAESKPGKDEKSIRATANVTKDDDFSQFAEAYLERSQKKPAQKTAKKPAQKSAAPAFPDWATNVDDNAPGHSILPDQPARPAKKSAPSRTNSRVDAEIKKLASNDPAVVEQAIDALGQMGPEAASAEKTLNQLLLDEDPAIRVHAALAMGRIGSPTDAVVNVLMLGLRDQDEEVRVVSAFSLAEVAPLTPVMVRSLTPLLQDSDPEVRLYIASFLIHDEKASAKALNVLLFGLQDQNEAIRALTVNLIGSLAPQSQEAVVALAESLQDPAPEVREGAAIALGEIGSAAKPAISALRQATRDSERSVRAAANEALSRIEDAVGSR